MKIGDFFDTTKFGGIVSAAVLAAAIMFIIQLGWTANNRLLKMESEHIQMSKENHEEFGKIHEEFGKIHEEFGKVYEEFGKVYEELEKINATLAILGEIQSQLEDLKGIESAVDTNKTDLDELDKKTEYLKGQVETILSNK